MKISKYSNETSDSLGIRISVLAPSNSQHRKCGGLSESSHILCHEFTKKSHIFPISETLKSTIVRILITLLQYLM